MQRQLAIAASVRVSVSSDKSLLQAGYEEVWKEKCEEFGVDNHPFELDANKMQEFFNAVSVTWKERKLALYKDGQIAASDV